MPKKSLTNQEARDKLNSLGLKYDFSLFEYNGSRTNESVVYCSVHGRFKASYHNIFKSKYHLGLVCKKCRNENIQKILLEKHHGENFKPDNMTYKQRKYWTKERCASEAQNYKTQRLFGEKSPVAFKIALQNNWLNEICSHTLKNRKCGRHKGTSSVKWDRVLCHIEALKYQSKRDFSLHNRSAHDYAYRHGFLNEICTHMITLGNRRHKCVYVYEFPDKSVYVGITNDFQRRKLDREKRQYDTVTQYIFQTGLSFVHKQITDYIDVEEAVKLEEYYVSQYKNDGWKILNKCKTGGRGGDTLYWTYEKCIEEGRKYKHRSEFNTKCKGAYDACRKNGWLADVYAHMIPYDRSTLSIFWTKERCASEAQKYSRRTDFDKNSSGAYFRARKNGWLDEICQHMDNKRIPKITKEQCLLIASQYDNKHDFRVNSPQAYSFASRFHWIKECTVHMISKSGAGRPHYNTLTKDVCMMIARQYNDVSEWVKYDRISYNTAWRNKWLAECKTQMKKYENSCSLCEL